jgi:integrase
MRRPSKPWYRKFNDTWYATVRGEQVPLARGRANRAEAERAFHKLMAGDAPARPARPQDTRVVAVLDLFLDHSQRHNRPRTYEWYRSFLQGFSDLYGALRVEDLRPFHVTRWLDAHPDWKGTRWGAVTAVKRAFNWAADEGLIAASPVKKVKKPPMRARQRFVTPEERQKILDSYPEGDCFRDFLFALEHTGCRPGEVSMVTAAHVDLRNGVWVLGEHKTEGKTQAPRVVILTPEMVDLTERLMVRHPEGPLFRNGAGGPWNRNAVRCRFRRVRKKLGLGGDLVAYLYRHAVATDLLESGAGVAQAAEILGHKGTEMILRHYSKLRERREHLRDRLRKARGDRPAEGAEG